MGTLITSNAAVAEGHVHKALMQFRVSWRTPSSCSSLRKLVSIILQSLLQCTRLTAIQSRELRREYGLGFQTHSHTGTPQPIPSAPLEGVTSICEATRFLLSPS